MKKMALSLIALLSISSNAYYFRCVDQNDNQILQISANSKSVESKSQGHYISDAYLDLTLDKGSSYISADGEFTTDQKLANYWGLNGVQIEINYDQDENAHKVVVLEKGNGVILDQFLRCHSKL